jgi:hypothetical protein
MAKKKLKKAAPKQAKPAARRAAARKPSKAKAARKPAARPVKKKAPAKAARKAARPVKKSPVRSAKPTARTAKRTPPKPAARIAKKAAAPVKAKPVAKAKPAPASKRPPVLPPPPTLQRERRRLPEAEEEAFTDVSEDSRLMSSARAGHDELRSELQKHTEAGPELTAGDVDAKWQDAYALGDEAPGGDNMTPDQDRVDDIGKALGIEYADDEELLGGEELVERDEHRWELDPASKEDDEEI